MVHAHRLSFQLVGAQRERRERVAVDAVVGLPVTVRAVIIELQRRCHEAVGVDHRDADVSPGDHRTIGQRDQHGHLVVCFAADD
jgi:hypothetical protein